jgi:hypothetical protein
METINSLPLGTSIGRVQAFDLPAYNCSAEQARPADLGIRHLQILGIP